MVPFCSPGMESKQRDVPQGQSDHQQPENPLWVGVLPVTRTCNDWAYIALLATKNTPWGNGVLNGNTANPDLKWETTYSTNLGLDLNLFDNRIEFIADFYYKKTKDMLLQAGIYPHSLGSSGQGAASNPWSNIGSLENKGVELTLNTVNIRHQGLPMEKRTSYSHSTATRWWKWIPTTGSHCAYSLQVGSDTQTVTNSVAGKPIAQFWGYKVIGRFDEPTDFYYTDANGAVKEVARPINQGHCPRRNVAGRLHLCRH